jgi:hypothetical protein
VYTISLLWVDVLICKSSYLESCIWPDVLSREIRQSNSECASNFVRRSNFSVLGYHWWRKQQLRLWPWEKTTILPMEKPKLARLIAMRQVKSKVKSMLIIFFDITRNSSWWVKQSIPHTTVTFLSTTCKCAKTSPRALATKQLDAASRQSTGSHVFFHRRIFFTKKQHDCRHPSTLLAWLGPSDVSLFIRLR